MLFSVFSVTIPTLPSHSCTLPPLCLPTSCHCILTPTNPCALPHLHLFTLAPSHACTLSPLCPPAFVLSHPCTLLPLHSLTLVSSCHYTLPLIYPPALAPSHLSLLHLPALVSACPCNLFLLYPLICSHSCPLTLTPSQTCALLSLHPSASCPCALPLLCLPALAPSTLKYFCP